MVVVPPRRGPGRPGSADALRRLLPWLFVSLGALLLLPSWLDVESASVESGIPQVDGLRWTGGLVLIGGLLAALPGLLRRVATRPGEGGRRRIDVLEVRPLAPRRQLYLVEVDGQTLLLGSSEAGLSRLAQLNSDRRFDAEFSRAVSEAEDPA